MPSRDEILSIYQSGPDALVVWVEHLLAAQAGQTEQLLAAHSQQTAQLVANQALLEQQDSRMKCPEAAAHYRDAEQAVNRAIAELYANQKRHC
jgi:hypothetical protein